MHVLHSGTFQRFLALTRPHRGRIALGVVADLLGAFGALNVLG